MTDLDPFAYARADNDDEDSDEAILTLFREWRDGMERLAARNLTDDDYDPLLSALTDIQRQVFDAETRGLIGLAVKAFMLAYEVQLDDGNGVKGDHPCSLSAFGQHQYGAKRTLMLLSHALRALVVDAVRFLPELAPLAGRLIDAPVVLPDDETDSNDVIGKGDAA